jgi:hypothetical protein
VVAFGVGAEPLANPRHLSAGSRAGRRVGLPALSRLDPPRAAFAGCEPNRILFGHGREVFDGAGGALRNCLDGARLRAPRALVFSLHTEVRAMLPAVWDSLAD